MSQPAVPIFPIPKGFSDMKTCVRVSERCPASVMAKFWNRNLFLFPVTQGLRKICLLQIFLFYNPKSFKLDKGDFISPIYSKEREKKKRGEWKEWKGRKKEKLTGSKSISKRCSSFVGLQEREKNKRLRFRGTPLLT